MEETPQAPEWKYMNIDNVKYKTTFNKKFANRKKYVPDDPRLVLSFIPGTVRNIFVKEGQQVAKGEPLLELEAMKLLNLIQMPEQGRIRKINVTPDESVPKNHLLVEIDF